jgi:hypothetical protein
LEKNYIEEMIMSNHKQLTVTDITIIDKIRVKDDDVYLDLGVCLPASPRLRTYAEATAWQSA